jgi:DNA-binding PadR family transcriptional regulator
MHSHERPTHGTRHNRVVADDLGSTRKRHGGPFGGPGFGPRGRGRRRRGDVRTALLLLLADEPSNGYQLMQTLEERTEGRWRPSPGSVYPALAQLEDEGLIRSVPTDSTGRTFEITDAGREQVAERGERKPPWDDEDPETDAFKAFRHTIGSTVKAAAQVAQEGDPEQVAKAVEILKEARRSLYRLLAGDDSDS